MHEEIMELAAIATVLADSVARLHAMYHAGFDVPGAPRVPELLESGPAFRVEG